MATLPSTERRRTAVAGMFYPAEPQELSAAVESHVAAAALGLGATEPMPKAIVVPHAGYIYSGPIAGSAFARLRAAGAAERIERVVLIGPAHRAYVTGLVWPGVSLLETPLGDIEVDVAAIESLKQRIAPSALAHAAEHSLEVELPFIKRVLPRARVVPLAAGDASAASVGAVLEALWGGPETLIVISSDLSHYHPYAEAVALDRDTVARIVALDAEDLPHDRACGATGISGLSWVAKRRGLTARMFDLRNSGDTAGDKRRVVGYAAIGFYENNHS